MTPPPVLDALPEELAAHKCWLGWRWEWKPEDGHWAKVPINPRTGLYGSHSDPATWAAQGVAIAGMLRLRLAGLGYAFTTEHGVCGVDLDHCVDANGAISPEALAIVELLDSYTEISVSGTGLHILIYATIPGPRRRNNATGVEMYGRQRFFTMSGRVVREAPIREAQPEMDALYEAQFGPINPPAPLPPAHPRGDRVALSDDQVLDLCWRAGNAAKIRALWDGQVDDNGGMSGGDLGLCNHLVFYTGDAGQIDRLIQQSGRMREKWASRRGRSTYGLDTIDKALRECAEWYSGGIPWDGVLASTVVDAEAPEMAEEPETQEAEEEQEKPQKKPPKDIYMAARRWAKVYGDVWSHDDVAGLWRHWTGTHHQEVPQLSTALDKQAIAVLLGSRMPVGSGGRLTSVIRFAATLCTREFPPPARLVNFANGTLDLKDWSLRAHDPADGLTYCLSFPYQEAEYDLIAEFLAETIPDSYGILALMTHIGLALMGDLRLHYTVLLIGPKRSGKSTCLQLANAACGQPPEANAGPSIFNRDSEGLRSRASWNGRRVVTLEELPVEALKNEELVKAMVAHGGVEMRQMYQRAILENRWRPKLLMATNERPQYSDRTGALTERIVPISCPNGRSKSDRDPLLFERMSAQIGGFAVACLHQAQQVLTLQRGQYPMSEAMGELLDDIEKGGDPLKAFVRDECRSGPNEWAPTDSLYTCYHRYCQEYGYKSVGKEMFSRALCDRYDHITARPKKVDGKPVRCLEGLSPIRPVAPKLAEVI